MVKEDMTKPTNLFSRIPFYIAFLGVYPVLFLWLTNYEKIHGYVVPRSLIISFVFSTAVFLIFWLIFRPVQKAGLLAGIWLVLFFAYGHIFSLIDNASLLGFIIGRHRFLIPIWVLLGLVGSYFVIKSRSTLATMTQAANFIFGFLTAAVLLQIGLAAASSIRPASRPVNQPPTAPQISNALGAENQPDVYYILLDGYGRQDLLKKDLNLDVGPFIDQLKSMGFIIPDCGQSNYIDTANSMAATLNMNYLDALGFSYQELATQDHEKLLTPVIVHSAVRQKFQSMGYQFITYKSPYLFIDMPDSDIYLDAETATNPGEKLESLNFQRLFIKTTFARTAAEWLEENPQNSKKVPAIIVLLVSPGSLNPESSTFAGRNYQQYKQNVFQLESLQSIPENPKRKFIYAHLLVTHQPFTFTSTGEFRTEEKDSYESYKDQIKYVNTQLPEIITTILEKSKVPPVIIIQGDHSFSDGGKRARNLQAYYFPGKTKENVPSSFTNLNAFRFVFDNYFGDSLPLLPDKSFQIGKDFPGYTKSISASCIND
jgi:hypothetical protein